MDRIFDIIDQDPEIIIVLLAVSGGLTIAVISIVTGAITSVAKTAQRERSRRELAAYIAEGTMSPDIAERMMEAGGKVHAGKCRWFS